jgi:two-component system, NarL family, nitrate/nitrite response regulator NarL
MASESSPMLDDSRCVRIFVIAEVRLYREGIAQDLARRPSFELVGTSDDPSSSVDELLEARPDVLLLCATQPRPSAAVRDLASRARGIPLVALAVPDEPQEALAWVEAGAVAFLTCDASLDDLSDAVARAARGEAMCSPKMVGSLLRQLGSLARFPTRAGHPHTALTTREREIVHLIADGLSNKEIAHALHIEVTTVKNHVHHILEKLQVGRRSEAAMAIGLVPAKASRSSRM